MAINATVGDASANSYITLLEANNYFFSHPYATAWDFQEAELLYATVLLDSLVSWDGTQVDTTQRLQWPRTLSGASETEIPLDIKNAQCELILYLLANTSVVEDDSIDTLKVGPIQLDFNEKKAGNPDLLPAIVKGFVSRWGTVNSANFSVSTTKLVRA